MNGIQEGGISFRQLALDPSCGPAGNGPVWLERLKKQSFSRLQESGLPDRRWESWKYMDLEPVFETAWNQVSADGALKAACETSGHFSALSSDDQRMVFLNGRFAPAFNSGRPLNGGARVSSMAAMFVDQSETLRHTLEAPEDGERDPLALINTRFFRDGVFLHIPKGRRVEGTLHFVFLSASLQQPGLSFPRIAVHLEEDASVQIALHHLAHGAVATLTDSVFDLNLERGAHARVLAIQEGTSASTQVLKSRIKVASSASFESVSFSHGGRAIRQDHVVDLEGAGASASIHGLSVLDGSSSLFEHVTMNHRAGHGTSHQFFKNILAGKAQAEFDSLSRVFPETRKNDSRQLNRNLILSDEARVWSRPQLKIEADDVSASHGSATGRLDQGELFYLRSRGLSKDTARFVLTYGFAEEILKQIDSVPVRARLEAFVRQKIEELVL